MIKINAKLITDIQHFNLNDKITLKQNNKIYNGIITRLISCDSGDIIVINMSNQEKTFNIKNTEVIINDKNYNPKLEIAIECPETGKSARLGDTVYFSEKEQNKITFEKLLKLNFIQKDLSTGIITLNSYNYWIDGIEDNSQQGFWIK